MNKMKQIVNNMVEKMEKKKKKTRGTMCKRIERNLHQAEGNTGDAAAHSESEETMV